MTDSGSQSRRRKRGIKLELDTGTVELPPGESYRPSARQVDLCFVFDTTGSMSNKIEGLVTCMVDLVRDFDELSLDWRLSVLPFGDLTIPGDRIVTDSPFVIDRAAAEAELRQMVRNSGGSNEGESSIEAMEAALRKVYRSAAVKILILLTDEPALGGARRAAQLERELRQKEFIAFTVSPDLPYYKSWATSSGGAWFAVAAAVDTSAILEMLRQLAADLARVAHEVHALAGGSVRAYRELGRGDAT
jgi:von Willebrand factor type A domain